MMNLIRLTQDYNFTAFDCGDEDLNQFLLEDAKRSQELCIANTFILEDDGRIVASSYPTIKIGRFAVSLDYRGHDIGSKLLTKIKGLLKQEQGRSAFRYLTVDAYLSAVPFYEKNHFVQLNKKDEDEHTRLMFYDMMDADA